MKMHSTLAFALSLALVAGVQAQQVRDQAGPPRVGSAVLAGTVVTNEQTPQPVRRATMTVVNAEGTVSRTAFSDEAGRFKLTGLPDGRYTLTGNKPPFLRTAYGAKRYDLPGTPITLKDGAQMTNIVLRLTKGAVLSGRITDENGEPAFGVSVRVLQMRVQFGERTFVPVAGGGSSSDQTDDRGMYRLFGLPPGEYAVTASPRVMPGEIRAMTDAEIRAIMQALQQQQAAQQSAQYGQKPPASGNPAQVGATAASPQTSDADKVTVAYSPVYYPGTTSASTASTITIAAGEERTGVDIPLRLVRTTTVEGTVIVPPGIAPQSVQLSMMPTAPVSGVGLAGLEVMAMQRVSVGADGKFTYTAVAPGQYTISARASKPAAGAPPPPPPPPPPPGGGGAPVMGFSRTITSGGDGMPMSDMMVMMGDQGGAAYWATADVPVDGTPIAGVTLSLQPGMTITGKVEFRSTITRPGGDFKRVQLNLMPAPNAGGAMRITTGVPTAQVDETGRFTITGVTPGRYRLVGNAPVLPGSGPGPAWRLGSAVVKGRDALDFPLDIAPNEDVTDAVITFTDATQEVNGSLQDASGRPAPDYTIVVFAADKGYWTPQSRRVRTTRPGTDGKFTVANLPPGDYRMAAVVDVSPTEINDPAFLEQLVGASFPIKLALGEKKTQDLKIAGGL